MRVVILAGGRGTRLAPYTVAFPKPLMPLVEEPILEIVVKQLKHYGATRITLAVGHFADLIQAYCGDGSKYGIPIDYSREERPLGTAGPLRLIEDLEEDFLVVNGDLLTDLNFAALMHRHVQQGNDATIGVYSKEVKIDLGVLSRDPEGRVTGYDEKPALHYEISMGVYALNRSVLHLLPEDYFDFPDLVLELIRRQRRIRGFSFDGTWLDLGREADYEKAVQEFEAERKRFLPGD